MKNPKKLNLYEMWELYSNLGYSKEKYAIDEVILLLQTKPHKVKKSLKLMYDTVSTNPLEYALMIIRGLNKNRFFDFQEFIGSISGRT